jgi:hypothetical protein
MTDHSITPPQWRVQEWWEQADQYQDDPKTYFDYVATEAARWGADQELEACCDLLVQQGFDLVDYLRAARRPKPPSLKEQALKELAWVAEHLDMPLHNRCNAIHAIHQALEQLPDKE